MRQEVSNKRLVGEQRTPAKTILVVEDDEATQEFLMLLFTSATVYHYQPATNASQAVDFAKRITPDLFLVDYQLTDMNGLELYDLMHATPGLESVPVLLLTATKLEALRPEIEKRQIGALEKPFDLDELLCIVQRILGEP